jgi:uncharacterized protein YukE
VLDAHKSSLVEYLDRPVHETLSRLGLSVPVTPGWPNAQTQVDSIPLGGGQSLGGQNAALSSLASLASLPMMLIQPVTDALGTLGSGQFGGLDPTAVLGGIGRQLEAAGQSVQQAIAGLDGVWQGQAASAAVAKATAALSNGAQISSQADSLGASLSAAAAGVGLARAELVEIVGEFMATLEAIGPNIIFPWGWAAVIAAANQAVTRAAQTMGQLVGSLDAEAAHVSAAGAPVAVTSAPLAGTGLAATPAASLGAPASAASAAGGLTPTTAFSLPSGALAGSAVGASVPVGAASGFGSSFMPLVGIAASLASPAMEGVSAATGAIQSGAGQAVSAQLVSSPGQQDQADDDDGHDPHKAVSGGGVGHGGVGGVPVVSAQSRTAAPVMAPAGQDVTAAAMSSDAVMPAAAGGAPMMAGGPLGRGGNVAGGKSHNAAAFLHTTDQGDDIVGDLGGVAPSVIGVREADPDPEIDLRI